MCDYHVVDAEYVHARVVSYDGLVRFCDWVYASEALTSSYMD